MRAENVVLGCGIAGAFAAYTIAREGGEVLVIDRMTVGRGATPNSAGVITVHLDLEEEVLLAVRSIELYHELARGRELGELGLRNTGFLTIMNGEELDEYSETLRSLGIHTKVYDGRELKEMYPDLVIYYDEGGVWSGIDLVCEPRRMIGALRNIVSEHGARLLKAEIAGVKWGEDGIDYVLLEDGTRISGDRYIVALGPYTSRVTGIQYPHIILRCPAFKFRLNLRGSLPAFEDDVFSSYWRPSNHSTIVGGGYTADFIEDPSEAYTIPGKRHLKFTLKLIKRRFKEEVHPELLEGWTGPCSLTEDLSPIAGRIRGNTYMVEGLRGYGLMLGPALSEAVAMMALGKKPPINISAYSPGRFGHPAP